MQTRYSDLDVNGHVNGMRLLGMVMDSRHRYYSERWNRSAKETLEKGIAFYTTKITSTFKKSLGAEVKVLISSHVKAVAGPVLVIHFDVKNAESEDVYCIGHFEQVLVSPLTEKALDSCPETLHEYLFEGQP